MSDFFQDFTERAEKVNQVIKEFSPKGSTSLVEAMNYSLFSGGKRLRPVIMFETFKLFGGKHEKLIKPFLAAIEMIHTYSLIHDDLPAFDNDDYRRGKLSNHKKFGESTAILAGDGLLNFAMETAVKSFDCCNTLEEYFKVTEGIKVLFSCSGINGMLTGQLMDMSAGEGEDFFKKMYELKTAKLFVASFKIGALLAGADEKALEKLNDIALSFGVVFQLKDDLLDVEGDSEKLGKAVKSDEKNNKFTYLNLLGMERVREFIGKNSDLIIEHLSEISKQTDYDGFILKLIEFLKSRDS